MKQHENDPDLAASPAPRDAAPLDAAPLETAELESRLRRLRLADPSPDLRRRTLVAAGEALAADPPPTFGWWRELALAAAAAGLFALSLPHAFPAKNAASPTPAAATTPAELVDLLEPDSELSQYLRKRWPTRPGSADFPSTLSSFNHDPS